MTLRGSLRQVTGGFRGRRWRARMRRLRHGVRRVTAAALGPVLAAAGAVLPAVPATIAAAGVAAAAAAASVTAAPPAKAQSGAPVLVLVQNGESTAPEATALQAAGYSVTQATPATWLGMTVAQFEGYAALVIGDPSAGGSCSTLTPSAGSTGSDAIGTTWQQAVTGNIAVLGTAPALPGSTASSALITGSAAYAAAGYSSANSGTASSGTGLYVSLNCEYSAAAAGTDVTLLDGVEGIGSAGGLTVQGSLACTDPGTVNTWEAAKAGTFGGFTSSSLTASSWGSGCPVDEAFGRWPAMFTPAAYDAATDAAKNFTASDGASGQPYVLLGAPVTAATAKLAPSAGGEVLGGTTAGGTANPAAPGVQQGSAGDPVNTENGDFTQSSTDLSLPGFGPSLNFTRTYDSSLAQQETQAGTPGPMGYGWTDNWATSLAAARPTPGDIYAAAGLRTDNGNGGPATQAIVNNPAGVTVDGAGNVYFADTQDNRIQEVPAATGTQWGISMTAGDVYTVAGQANGQFELPLGGGTATGTPALQAVLHHPEGVAVDSQGNLFIADTGSCRVVEVEPIDSSGDGGVYPVAGTGTCGYNGDGISATSAELNQPTSIHLGQGSQAGDLYIADSANNRIREIPAGVESLWGISGMQAYDIYTVAGNGTAGTGSGVAAASAVLSDPQGVTIYGTNLLIADTGNCRVAEVPQSGGTQFGISMTANDLYDVAGRYSSGSVDCALGNDNKTATTSDLNYPTSVRDPNGTLYIADTSNNRIQQVSSSDIVTTTASGFSAPQDLWPDGSGNIYVADTGDKLIQQVPAGSSSPAPFAGGSPWALTDTGNGGAAVTAALNNPAAVASDRHGDVFIADASNNRIQEIAAWTHTQYSIAMTAGDVYTVAGNQYGAAGDGGDGGPATGATLQSPGGVAVDAAGNLYIADTGNAIIREVAASTGNISTIAGTPGATGAFSGNGTAATSATLGSPAAVAVDAAGDVLIADSGNNEILDVPAATGTSYGISMTSRISTSSPAAAPSRSPPPRRPG